MKRRMIVVLLAIMLTLSMVSVTSAQDLCFGLSAEDCAFINEASLSTMDQTSSFNSDFSIDFTVTGVPEGDVTFNLVGSGPMMLDEMAPEGTFPIEMDLTMDVQFSGPDGDGAATVGFMIVDGIAYVDAGDGSWMGIDILAAMDDPSVTSQLPVDPNDLAAGDLSALEDMGLDIEAFAPVLMGVPALFEAPGVISYTRDGDVFNFDVDIAAMISSDAFGELMTQAAEAGGEDAAMLPMVGAMAPLVLPEAAISVTQTVADGLITGLSFGTNALIDPAAMGEDAEPVAIDLLFDVTVSDVNAGFEFTAPEGAEMLPLGG